MVANRTIKSIYFGGGTPSLLSPQLYEKILKQIPFDPSIEVTLEANPENLTLELLRGFFSAGFNRLSIGAQSFDDEHLKTLGRTHNSQTTLKALADAHLSGFKNISIDLMYDLPNQTEASWLQTLKVAISQPITHLSLYNLTIEPETAFFKRRKQLILPSPEASLFMYEAAQELLPKGHLFPYEISAFAKPGFYSRHNTGYWVGREFLGLGPSAFSYFGGQRFRNVPHFGKYQKALLEGSDPSEPPDQLNESDRKKELLAVMLRLTAGVDLRLFQKKYGSLEPTTLAALASLKEKGWIVSSENILQLSKQGILFYDSVAVEII